MLEHAMVFDTAKVFDRMIDLIDERQEARSHRRAGPYQRLLAQYNELQSLLRQQGMSEEDIKTGCVQARDRKLRTKGTLFQDDVSAAGNRVRLTWLSPREEGEHIARKVMEIPDNADRWTVLRKHIENCWDGANLRTYLSYMDGLRSVLRHEATLLTNLEDRAGSLQRALAR